MPHRHAEYRELCGVCREPASDPCPQCALPLCGSHARRADRPCPGCLNWCMECGVISDQQCLRCTSYICGHHWKKIGDAAVCRACGSEYHGGTNHPETLAKFLVSVTLFGFFFMLTAAQIPDAAPWMWLLVAYFCAALLAVPIILLQLNRKQRKFLETRVPRRPVLITPDNPDGAYTEVFEAIREAARVAVAPAADGAADSPADWSLDSTGH